jgi:hypothetical protein
MEQLEAAYQKELSLADKHKKAAADIKKQMEFQQSKTITAKFNAMNMNGAEYERFIHLLASGKKTVLEAADLALNKNKKEVGENDED